MLLLHAHAHKTILIDFIKMNEMSRMFKGVTVILCDNLTTGKSVINSWNKIKAQD